MRTLFKQPVECVNGVDIANESHRESESATKQDVQASTGSIVKLQTVIRNGRETQPVVMPVLGFTGGVIALHVASYAVGQIIRSLFLPSGGGLTTKAFEEAYRWITPLQWGTWAITMLLITVAASYLSPRVARWGIGVGNLLFYLAVTTQYSLTASPIWVLSWSQLTVWGQAIIAMATVSVAQVLAAEQISRLRNRQKAKNVRTPTPFSPAMRQSSQ